MASALALQGSCSVLPTELYVESRPIHRVHLYLWREWEVDLNCFEALNFFFFVGGGEDGAKISNCLKLPLQLRWLHFHFICIPAVEINFIRLISFWRKISVTWILASFFVQILDLIYWKVLIFILIYFEWPSNSIGRGCFWRHDKFHRVWYVVRKIWSYIMILRCRKTRKDVNALVETIKYCWSFEQDWSQLLKRNSALHECRRKWLFLACGDLMKQLIIKELFTIKRYLMK